MPHHLSEGHLAPEPLSCPYRQERHRPRQLPPGAAAEPWRCGDRWGEVRGGGPAGKAAQQARARRARGPAWSASCLREPSTGSLQARARAVFSLDDVHLSSRPSLQQFMAKASAERTPCQAGFQVLHSLSSLPTLFLSSPRHQGGN